MDILSKITPINIVQEKKKFFSNKRYNPQFKYSSEIIEEEIVELGYPDETLALAVANNLDEVCRSYRQQNYGGLLSIDEVKNQISDFVKSQGISSEVDVIYANDIPSRGRVNKKRLFVNLDYPFHSVDIKSFIYHEIGTHILRRINHDKQDWAEKFQPELYPQYEFIEEGLAVFHSLLPLKLKMPYRSMRLYYAVFIAHHNSFADTFSTLLPFCKDQEECWKLSIRVKKGLSDTSLPGGFTKDIAYFQGFIQVLQILQKEDTAIEKLYIGKLPYDLLNTLFPNSLPPILPIFFTDDSEYYYQQLEKAIQQNKKYI